MTKDGYSEHTPLDTGRRYIARVEDSHTGQSNPSLREATVVVGSEVVRLWPVSGDLLMRETMIN